MNKVKLAVLAIGLTAVFFAGQVEARVSNLDGLMDSRAVWTSNDSSVSIRLQDPEEEKPEMLKDVDLSGFGGFGGVLLQNLFIDNGVFDPMTDDRGVDNFEENMLLIGGLGGFIYEDFRFGGFGFGNSQDTADRDVLGNRYSAEMSYGGGGVFIELNRTLTPNFGLAIGSLVGAGAMQLEASGLDMGPDRKWEADESFFMAYPYGGFWLAPTKWMWLQLDAGYMFFEMDTGSSEFENDLGVEMVDGDITGGFSASAKICFGWNPNG